MYVDEREPKEWREGDQNEDKEKAVGKDERTGRNDPGNPRPEKQYIMSSSPHHTNVANHLIMSR